MPQVKARPKILKSTTIKKVTDHGNMYITIGYKVPKKPFEVFLALGKPEEHQHAWTEALAKCVSIGLRSGVTAQVFIDQLRGITCGPILDGKRWVRSPADALAQALQEFCFPESSQVMEEEVVNE